MLAALMIVLALAAAWASLNTKPLILLFAFVGSFVPSGFYMLLLTPSPFKWIGVGNLLYLVAGLLMLSSRRSLRLDL